MMLSINGIKETKLMERNLPHCGAIYEGDTKSSVEETKLGVLLHHP
jgi:hypothetical protein